jgi:hypothetical protein
MKRVLVLLTIAFMACAASADRLTLNKYILPRDTTSTATARFPKGNLRLSVMRGDAQYYGIMRDQSYRSTQKLAFYNAGIGRNNQEAIVTLEAGHPVKILASIAKQSDGGYRYEQVYRCMNVVGFTPIANKKYVILQSSGATKTDFGCDLAVTDEDSGQSPADVERIPPPACAF